ncbi:MAG TPA: inositol-3-phosphate synthase, partial [Thermoanaerobaculia bacterium]
MHQAWTLVFNLGGVFMSQKGVHIEPADGKLGVLLVGLGAVSTTFIAGVEAVKRGLGKPIGSLTQMGTVRLGKRTENRAPRIQDFVPLARLDDLVFGAWDIFPDDAYAAACEANVLERSLLDQLRPDLEAVRPMQGVFDPRYVKRLHGTYIKEGTKWELARQLIDEIETFERERGVDRSVMVWCGSTEIHMCAGEVHETLDAFEAGLRANDDEIPASMVYAYAALSLGI